MVTNFCKSAIDSHRAFGVKCLPFQGCRESGRWGKMTRTTRRLGVVLFQLGGPDTLEAIEPFLYNLFCDPDIIDFPFARIGRKPLAKLISATRARKVQHHYATIGGGSPIRKHTERQARALEAELQNQGRSHGLDARCFVAMRYWHPFTHEAIAQVRAAQCEEIVLLPLYPQYSSTTTGSSLNEWRRLFTADVPVHCPGHCRVHCIETFYRNTMYLDSVVEKVNEALARFDDPIRPEILFSAHGVPMSVIEKGDPYQAQIEETVQLLMARGGWSNPHRLCYQSKVGASRWLQPSLRNSLESLAAKNVREACVVPVAFVSDHVETLGEIDHEAREYAQRLGFTQFEMSAGLNDSPKFIQALAQIVLGQIRLGQIGQEALDQPIGSLVPIHDIDRQPAVPEYATAAGLD
jgi:protoporphyrin/coproporphyrin ferrochelatase